MSKRKMWFGIPGVHMQWVPCPSIDSGIVRNRYVERMQFENGGGDARRSAQHQMQYDFNFTGPAHEVEGIDAFHQFASGFYGDGLIYLAHPADYETNMFPAAWASPGLIEQGWANIGSNTPSFGATNVSQYAQPPRSATWNVGWAANEFTKSTKIVIPPTHTLHVGVSGLATGSGVVSARPINTDGTFGAVVNLTLLSKSGSTRMNTTFSGADYQAVEFYITRTIDTPVVVRNLVTNPSMEAGSGVVTVRTNLVTNPSFETGTTGWFGAGTLTRITTDSYSGSACLQTVTNTVQQQAAATILDSVSTLGAYTLSLWVKGESGKSLSVDFRELQSDGTTVVDTVSGPTITATGSWQRVSVSNTLTATNAKPQIIVRNQTSGSHTILVDAVQLEVGSTATDYFDGSTAASGDFTYAWSGTAHASTSLQQGIGVNLTSTGGGAKAIQSSEWSSSGSKSVRIIPTRITTDGESYVDVKYLLPAASTMAGKTYTVIGKVRFPNALQSVTHPSALKFRATTYLTPSGNQPLTITHSSTANKDVGGVYEVRGTFTVPANATTWAFFRLYNGSNIDDVWWDDLIFVEGTYTGDYFDGNTTNAGLYTYAWDGAPNASTSTRTYTDVSTVTITSMMAQLHKTGGTPALPSNHYQGKGSTGLMFVDDAIVENYTYMYPPRKGISTTLVEVGAWR